MKPKRFTAVYKHELRGWCYVVDEDYTNKKKFEKDLRQVDYKKVTVLSDSEIEYIVNNVEDWDYVEKTLRYDWEVVEYVREMFKEKYTKNSAENKEKTEEKNTENSVEKEEIEEKKSTKNSVISGEIVCKIDIITEMKKNGYNASRIRKEKIIAECTMTELRKGIIRKIETLAIICSITGLSVSDVIEFRELTGEQQHSRCLYAAKDT